MKKIVAMLLCVYSFTLFSQDTTKTVKHKRKVYNEVGINATLLLRQVFGSSSSSVTPLPYNLTYKLIVGKWAVRTGFGISINNTTSEGYTSNQNSFYQTPPDQYVPSYTNSKDYYFRLGAEYRFHIGRKLLVYTGIDIAGQSLNTKSQTCNMNNELPNFYQFTKTNSSTTSGAIGIGPVVGIQFYCTKRFSVYTEIPFYYMTNRLNTQSTTYSNYFNVNDGPNYTQGYSDSWQRTTTKAFSITIPATLYLAVKF